jgi:uncharacterized membrane protein YgaE (UPF0421/DUF939 family)
MNLSKNMGTADRIIRPTLAAGIITLIATNVIKGTPAKILAGLSAIFIGTSSIGWCPAYEALGVDTLGDEE